MRKIFEKAKWDPYMDGIELRPRLHSRSEKIIFILSAVILAASLILLILPSGEKGVFDPGDETYLRLSESRDLGQGLVERTFESGEIYRLTGPYPADDEEHYTERWELLVMFDKSSTNNLTIYLGPENKSARSRAILFRQGTREFKGNWLSDTPEIVRGQRGRLYASDDNPYIEQIYISGDGSNYFTPNYEAVARMATNTLIGRKAALWRYLVYASLFSLASLLLTYFYNETFTLQRALMSLSYHRSEDIEPTGFYTFGHFLSSAVITGVAVAFFIIYLR